MQRAVIDQCWVPVYRFELLEDVLPQPQGVRQGIKRKGVLGSARHPIEVDPATQSQDQVIVGYTGDLLKLDLAPSKIDARYGRLVEVEVPLVMEQVAYRMADD